MIEQLLLWVSLALVVFLAAFRRDRRSLPWIGMGLSMLGIVVLVAHSFREEMAGTELDWLGVASSGSATVWRFAELTGLVCVGAGVTVMSLVADTERKSRKIEEEVSKVASQVGSSGKVLMSVLASAPGAGMLLRKPSDGESDFRVLFADDEARSILRGPGAAVEWLEQHLPRELSAQISVTAKEALDEHKMARSECEVKDRWYEVAAGAHGEGVLILLDDITVRKQAELSLIRAAYTDSVTGLANRTYLEQQMDEAVQRTRTDSGFRFAVMCLDFDDFKGVNDRYGHQTGDELLVSIGTRISRVLNDEFAGDSDKFLAARWGGDEFVLVLRGVDSARADTISRRLCEQLGQPHNLADAQIRSTASVGASMCDGTHETAAAVLQDADAAMYAAKNAGKNRVHLSWASGTEPIRFPGNVDGGPDHTPDAHAA
ncbi:MAG: hypothetical protein DHS20C14_10660 [Phycisphaeraceae bacterium]|nr:MAG: hypothetical protein DHS20C14_10660 [Phycisphaeraceae bacterium]